jgi:hypothetical protein
MESGCCTLPVARLFSYHWQLWLKSAFSNRRWGRGLLTSRYQTSSAVIHPQTSSSALKDPYRLIRAPSANRRSGNGIVGLFKGQFQPAGSSQKPAENPGFIVGCRPNSTQRPNRSFTQNNPRRYRIMLKEEAYSSRL